jgi:hypothetical protein
MVMREDDSENPKTQQTQGSKEQEGKKWEAGQVFPPPLVPFRGMSG